jgi:predicted Zn-dependent protease
MTLRSPCVAILSIMSLIGLGCTHNPATGRSQFLLMSTEEEVALGTEAQPQLTQEYGGEVQSRDLREYVTWVGERVARGVESDYDALPWQFTVLDSDILNAFALPGGKVFVSRGLMAKMSNEAQLAAALGHEIGHVTAQHADERISQAMLANGLATTAGIVGGEGWVGQAAQIVVGAGGQGYLLKFSRDQESEADRMGIRYMTRAGYDPAGMVDLLGVLVEAAQGSSQPEFLSTHPDPERRVRETTDLIDREYRGQAGNETYETYRRRWDRRARPHLASESAPDREAGQPIAFAAYWCGTCRNAVPGDDDILR